ncbi:hypothetical protein PITC_058440 [Penicillium italicum]|uniref:Uncharacterized protein n=1 Tax=Penicillium italicum TaxID=40296 RepID=A0A0A2L4Q7_PENIT|nr:hypothetical protein PITC_058440 [Penicillium italicum]
MAKGRKPRRCFELVCRSERETSNILSRLQNSVSAHLRRPLAQPKKPVQGSTTERKLDIGFVSDTRAGKDTRCQWSQILVPGELKSNPEPTPLLRHGLTWEGTLGNSSQLKITVALSSCD